MKINAIAQANPLPETRECPDCGGLAGLWEDDQDEGYQCYETGCGWSGVQDEIE